MHNPSNPYCESCKELLRYVTLPSESEKSDHTERVCPNRACPKVWEYLKEDPTYFEEQEIVALKTENYKLRKDAEELNYWRLAFMPNFVRGLGPADKFEESLSLTLNLAYAKDGAPELLTYLSLDADQMALFLKKLEVVLIESLTFATTNKLRNAPSKRSLLQRQKAIEEREEIQKKSGKKPRLTSVTDKTIKPRLSDEEKAIELFAKRLVSTNGLSLEVARQRAKQMLETMKVQ